MSRSRATNPSSLACLSCRSKHLKCDAKQPTCDRCATNYLECIYVRSKRGYAGRKKPETGYQVTADSHFSSCQPTQQTPVSELRILALPNARTDSLTPSSDATQDVTNQTSLSELHQDRLVGLYYRYVHPAHPFLVPHELLRQEPDSIPANLKHVICFVARPLCESLPWERDEFQSLFDECSNSDVFQVQALLLLTIAAYAHCERSQGDKAIRQAIKTAESIGLDSETFGCEHSLILRESWRRTWWELYSISGMLRVLNPSTPIVKAPHNRILPCHEAAYNGCRPTLSQTLSQMQERHFADEPFQYSSFAYRIEAARVLDEVLDFIDRDTQNLQSSSAFNTHRAAIRSYMLSLPASNLDIMDSSGTADELMFCALTTINLASILLNLPRSTLPIAGSFNTICQTKRPTAFTYENRCNVAAVESADTILQLLLDRSTTSLQFTSPCFSCIITCAATVHLLAYCLGQDQERAKSLREYFQVSIGALNVMSKKWPVARVAKGQLAQIAKEVFVSSSGHDPCMEVQQNSGIGIQPSDPVCDIQNDSWLQDFVNSNAELDFYVPA